jgi:hypothetical protein
VDAKPDEPAGMDGRHHAGREPHRRRPGRLGLARHLDRPDGDLDLGRRRTRPLGRPQPVGRPAAGILHGRQHRLP